MAQANPTAVTTPSLDDVWHDKKQLRTEILGGITAFFAISYIIVVNPMILADAKMPASLTMFSTIFVSVIGCMLMGIFADAPMILTPGMGVNAFFTYTLVVDMRLTWQQAIAVSIIGSVFYCIIAFSKLSQIISDGIPDSLKTGITVGIGVFLVQIGLQKAGLIKSGGSRSLLAFGSLADPSVILAIFGLVLSLWLFMRKVPGGFVISIAATTIVGLLFQIKGQTVPNASLGNLAHYGDIFMKGDFSQILTPKFLLAIFAMAMIQLFEAMGILEGMLPDKSKFKKSFEVSAFTTFLSGIFWHKSDCGCGRKCLRYPKRCADRRDEHYCRYYVCPINILRPTAQFRSPSSSGTRHYYHRCFDDGGSERSGLCSFGKLVPGLPDCRDDSIYR